MTELYLLFFQSSIATFTNFNKFLQREEPLIYSICVHVQTFMNKLASTFIKPNVIQQLKNAKKNHLLSYILLEWQKDDNDLFTVWSLINGGAGKNIKNELIAGGNSWGGVEKIEKSNSRGGY